MDHIEDFMSYRYYCKMYIVQKNTHKKKEITCTAILVTEIIFFETICDFTHYETHC